MTEWHDIQGHHLYAWDGRKDEVSEHLTFVGTIDLDDEPYQFHDLILFVRKADGVVMYATDSGCSCPSPFEDTQVKDLIETTADAVVDLVRGMAAPSVRTEAVRLARTYVKTMKKEGAK